MKPIPRSLLIHSAVLYEVTENAWQSETRTELAQLRHVRIEPSSRLTVSKDDRSVEISATLFYDCRCSRPRAVEFREGQRLSFGGQLYRVESIELIYDNRRLHHLEIGLCK